jgi:hypothetical protein
MQVTQTLDIALIGIPGLLMGLVIGYIIGGISSFRVINRISLGITISGIGGLILSLLLSFYFSIGSLEILFVILSSAAGYILGLVLNWTSPIKSGPTNHIIYEPDDDDAFDREIEEALSGLE